NFQEEVRGWHNGGGARLRPARICRVASAGVRRRTGRLGGPDKRPLRPESGSRLRHPLHARDWAVGAPARPRPLQRADRAMGINLIALIAVLGAFWDGVTTLRGVAVIFELVAVTRINPFHFGFAIVVTMTIFGFVIATHFIWSLKSDDLVTVLLRAAWVVCFRSEER